MRAVLDCEMWLVEEDGINTLCTPWARFEDGRGAPGAVTGVKRVLKAGSVVEIDVA
jgi:hypothetical protein